MDPRKMQKALSQMGIKTTPVNAKQVVIKTEGKDIVIDNPQVTEVNMQGIRSFQVIGDVKEETAGAGEKYSRGDVELVAEQAGVPEEEAKAALEKTDGDIAGAIMLLQKS